VVLGLDNVYGWPSFNLRVRVRVRVRVTSAPGQATAS
jgi:hypothetical protein